MNEKVCVEWTDKGGRIHMKILSRRSADSYYAFLLANGATNITIGELCH